MTFTDMKLDRRRAQPCPGCVMFWWTREPRSGRLRDAHGGDGKRDVEPSDSLAIVYTSGSTSTPKGVVHTHESLLAHQVALNDIRRLTADDRQFCNSPFFWIGGIAIAVLAPLLAGATSVCSNAADAADTLDLLEAERPTVTNGFVGGNPTTRPSPQPPGARPVVRATRDCIRSWRQTSGPPILS